MSDVIRYGVERQGSNESAMRSGHSALSATIRHCGGCGSRCQQHQLQQAKKGSIRVE
jgi:hypothetical protein